MYVQLCTESKILYDTVQSHVRWIYAHVQKEERKFSKGKIAVSAEKKEYAQCFKPRVNSCFFCFFSWIAPVSDLVFCLPANKVLLHSALKTPGDFFELWNFLDHQEKWSRFTIGRVCAPWCVAVSSLQPPGIQIRPVGPCCMSLPMSPQVCLL